jgi:PadR family transcriptional regulator, regulatory protein PadR
VVIVRSRSLWGGGSTPCSPRAPAPTLAGTGLTPLSLHIYSWLMARLSRITPATLDVLEALIEADADLHGFALAKVAHRPTGSVYVILSRLEDIGWVTSDWEQVKAQNEGRPRRRFYRLTPDGLVSARQTLAERRSATSKNGIRQWRPKPQIDLLGWIR